MTRLVSYSRRDCKYNRSWMETYFIGKRDWSNILDVLKYIFHCNTWFSHVLIMCTQLWWVFGMVYLIWHDMGIDTTRYDIGFHTRGWSRRHVSRTYWKWCVHLAYSYSNETHLTSRNIFSYKQIKKKHCIMEKSTWACTHNFHSSQRIVRPSTCVRPNHEFLFVF